VVDEAMTTGLTMMNMIRIAINDHAINIMTAVLIIAHTTIVTAMTTVEATINVTTLMAMVVVTFDELDHLVPT
jgi:predicted phosphoribosyltransferase